MCDYVSSGSKRVELVFSRGHSSSFSLPMAPARQSKLILSSQWPAQLVCCAICRTFLWRRPEQRMGRNLWVLWVGVFRVYSMVRGTCLFVGNGT